MSKATANNADFFRRGMRDGIPIGLGYLAVSFSLGIAARNAGVSAVQGFFASLVTLASAGEYAGFTTIAAQAPYIELIIVTFIANARYLLMSSALSQIVDPQMKTHHRFFIATFVTDEIFGITIARPGYLQPYYIYGAAAVAAPLWGLGTALGVIAGNLLPLRLVSAFSVALYGMFLAVIIPPTRQSRVITALIALCFAASFAASRLPLLRELSGGTRTILLTVIISAAAALLFPVKEDNSNEGGKADDVEKEDEHEA